jgi:hypothetical protein
MPIATHGGFDQVVEIDQTLLTAIARETFARQAGSTPLEQASFRGTATYDVAFHAIWLGMRNERWLPAELGPGNVPTRPARWQFDAGADTRPQVEQATITLDISVRIAITEILLDPGGWTAAPTDDFVIEFDGYVDVTASLDSRQMNIRTDRERPDSVERAWCAVIRLTGINFPRFAVTVDERRISRSLPVVLANLQALLNGGPLAAEANLQQVYAQIRQAIADAVRANLGTLTDWRHDENGMVVLYSAAGMAPAATGMGVRTLNRVTGAQPRSSLFIGVQTTGVDAATLWVTDSQLELGDTMCVTISHASFVRNNLLPAVRSTFSGLQGADLNIPLLRRWLIATTREVEIGGSEPFTLETLLVYVDDAERVHIGFTMRADRYGGGVTAHATIDLQLGFAAVVGQGPTGQALQVTPAILNADTAVVSRRADVAWWVYLLGGGLGGLLGGVPLGVALGAIIVGILDATVAENKFADSLNSQISGSTPAPSANPLPSDVDLAVTAVSLRQAGSRRLTDVPWNILQIWDHDLVIRLTDRGLPPALAVVCQVPDSADPGARIDALGVVPADPPAGQVRRLPIDTVIGMIEAGTHTFVARVFPDGQNPVDAPIAVVRANPPYLRTLAERPPLASDARNNLGNLPRCPAP